MGKFNYLDELFSSYLAATDERGEPWQADYRKYEDIFTKLVRVEARLEKGVLKAFKDLSTKTDQLVNWYEYENKAILRRASLVADPYEEVWVAFKAYLTNELIKQLAPAFGLGTDFTMRDAKLNLDFSEKDPPAIKWLRTHSAELVKNVTNNTRKRINQNLSTSIEAGLTRSEAATNLVPIINDVYRSEVIAHTESIRAFTQGRIQTVTQLGIPAFKSWRNTFNPCDICIELAKHDVIPANEQFNSSYLGAKIDGPPAHPWCRCSLRISFKPEDLE